MNVPVDAASFELPDYVLAAIKSGPVPRVRDTSDLHDDELTDGEAIIRFAEEHLLVPEGPLVGQPLELDIYQKAFICAVFDNDVDTALAILSLSRRNGKTFILAVILLAFVVGPMRSLNTSMCSGANSREQSSLVFDLAKLMLEMSPTLIEGIHFKYVDSAKTITGLRENVRYRAISAEAKTGLGKAYKVIIFDECGQVEAESTPFTDMLETSQANYDDAIMFLISTQAAGDASYLSQAIDTAIIERDPATVCHLYCADDDCDLDDQEQWQKANPGLGKFVSKKKLSQKMTEARLLPATANGIKNLHLNQRVSLESSLMSAEAWKKNLRPINEVSRSKKPIHIGLDLSVRSDLTAAIASWRDDNGDINVETHAFAPLQGVKQRELRDKTPWTTWAEQGFLQLTPGPVVDYEWVCKYLALQFAGCDIASIQFDRYRIDLFQEASQKTDFHKMIPGTDKEKNLGYIPVGQGFVSMGIRVDAFEQEALNGRLRTGGHPVLNLGVSQSIVVEDPAGNRKIHKVKSTARVDAAVACVMGIFPNSDGQIATRPFDVNALIG